MTFSNTILSAIELEVGYKAGKKNISIIKGLQVDIKSSSLTCLMGPNGVGKSTLLRTLCGVQVPLYGSIKIQEKPLLELSKNELAQMVSVVLTDSLNTGAITVRELVAMGRYPYKGWALAERVTDRQMIEKAIVQTHLMDIANKKITELSDGEKQKAMIARALCQNTPVIILDEPTAHLDLNNRVEVINLLKELAQESNKAILMATHELDLALQAADELWVLGFDKKLLRGFPEDLVLRGKIDEVFNLKGFDLKTGYLEKKVTKRSIHVIGEGHLFLWTKNALERNGFGVSSSAKESINILEEGEKVIWKNEKGVRFDLLENLIQYLNQT